MFYYVSFLRPPPLQALPSSSVNIVPQIANDLRTELFGDSLDIFYSWYPAGETDENSIDTAKPVRLTTWKHTNAYKEINVPLPPGVRDGQTWRLILSSEPQHISINFQDACGPEPKFGKTPFAVISMPINFTKHATKNSKKQEKIERRYSFIAPRLQNSENSRVKLTLKIIEQTSFDLDKKIWDSGIGLSSWLVSLAGNVDSSVQESDSAVAQLRRALFSPAARNIIELGAGTGIVALTLGALRSVLVADEGEPDDGCLITTDLPSAMPLLEQNIYLNSHSLTRETSCPRPEILDWNADIPPYTQALRGKLDAIIMADVTYNTASFPALIRTLSRLIKLNPIDKPPMILLGYKERDVAERTLWTMATEIGVLFELAGEKPGAGGAPVEVWIGQIGQQKA
ncbi:putative methyltransferase-domain-containing protein [Lentinula aff. detonsa]|uniref:Methyltransferase-domain-containing protein n=1 Tax=Lentinula aff. detonsa TaxID=2804958 RepID=A0AA38NRI9_9AGAR|nr:putative methyltransferase-domain-containing protein [Lentinula aff. detonsa]